MKSAVIVGPADQIEQGFGAVWVARVMRPVCAEDVTINSLTSEEACIAKLDEIAESYRACGFSVVRVTTMEERDAILAFVHGVLKRVLDRPLASLEIFGNGRSARAA